MSPQNGGVPLNQSNRSLFKNRRSNFGCLEGKGNRHDALTLKFQHKLARQKNPRGNQVIQLDHGTYTAVVHVAHAPGAQQGTRCLQGIPTRSRTRQRVRASSEDIPVHFGDGARWEGAGDVYLLCSEGWMFMFCFRLAWFGRGTFAQHPARVHALANLCFEKGAERAQKEGFTASEPGNVSADTPKGREGTLLKT